VLFQLLVAASQRRLLAEAIRAQQRQRTLPAASAVRRAVRLVGAKDSARQTRGYS